MRSLAATAAIFTCTLSSIAHAGPETTFDLSAATLADQDSTLASVKPLSASEMDSLLTLPDFVQPSTTVSPLDQADHPMIPLPSSFWVSLILLGGVAIYVVKHSRVPNFR